MPAKKVTRKQSPPKKSASSRAPSKKGTSKKSTGTKGTSKKARTPRSSPGLLDTATQLVGAVMGAATDLATEAIKGAVEAGQKMTGGGQAKKGAAQRGTGKRRSPGQKNRR